MAPTIYTPLDRATRQIRLAHLAPSPNLEFQPWCTLHIVSLDDYPSYEALSYVWGDPIITTPIRLTAAAQRVSDDMSGTSPVTVPAENGPHSYEWPVTTNLEAALRYLRHNSEVRIFWIDAICIDQTNLEERNHQVPLMKAIYSEAVAVQAWLGSPTARSDDGMEILRQMSQRIPLAEMRIGSKLIQDYDLLSLLELFKRPWWSRTWVQQEVVLAKRAVLRCGSICLEWNDIKNNIFPVICTNTSRFLPEHLRSLQDHLNDVILPFISIAGLTAEARRSRRNNESLLILALGRRCYHSDERDSIYGFLGLVNESLATTIVPNYGLSISEIYQQTALHFILDSNSLEIFRLTNYVVKEARHHPTWVPSWHTLQDSGWTAWAIRLEKLIDQELFIGYKKIDLKFELVREQVLKLSGADLDCVVRVGSVVGEPGPKPLLEKTREWSSLCGLNTSDQSFYNTGERLGDAFWRTLVNDTFWNDDEKSRRCQIDDREKYLKWLGEAGTVDKFDWKGGRFQIFLEQSCFGRRFFVTKKGYIGMGPAELEEGDEIYILAGGKVPFVLRPLPKSQPNTFELVGDCYVHGIMDGEAVVEKEPIKKRWKEAFARAKRFTRRRNREVDRDLPLRDFHDVFIV